MIETFLNTILPFFFILTVLVFVHELGHYLAAIKNRVKVEVFSTTLCISKYEIFLFKNESTAISLAAFKTVGALFWIFRDK